MHPEFGMGVEFSSKTQEHRSLMEEIIARLTLTEDLVPEVLVEPEGLDWGNDVEALSGDSSVPAEIEEYEEFWPGTIWSLPLRSINWTRSHGSRLQLSWASSWRLDSQNRSNNSAGPAGPPSAETSAAKQMFRMQL